MGQAASKPTTKIVDPDFQVLDIIEWKNTRYKVVGKDTQSGAHPGGFKKFDYILEDIQTKREKRVFIHMIQDAKKVKE